jgi:hypothetical protein
MILRLFLSAMLLLAAQCIRAETIAWEARSLTPEQYAEQNRMALTSMITDPQDVETIAQHSRDSDPATVGRAIAREVLALLEGLDDE